MTTALFGEDGIDADEVLLEEVIALRALVEKHMQATVLDMFKQAGTEGLTWDEVFAAVYPMMADEQINELARKIDRGEDLPPVITVRPRRKAPH